LSDWWKTERCCERRRQPTALAFGTNCQRRCPVRRKFFATLPTRAIRRRPARLRFDDAIELDVVRDGYAIVRVDGDGKVTPAAPYAHGRAPAR
jgi:hypothetical protein